MEERVTADAVKPNYQQVKETWLKLLRPYYEADGTLKREYLVDVDCPVCAGSQSQDDFVLNGFRHVTCRNCQTVYVTPRLNEACLAKLYSDEYYNTMFVESMIPAFETRKRLIGARKYGQINRYVSGVGRVLDIGCGVGEVIDVFKDSGWHSNAIEVNPSAVAWLKKRGIAVFEGTFDDYPETEKYNVIMAWGVVEHVVNPKEFLCKVRRHLLPDGLFVSEVPNGQSLLVDYCRATSTDPGRILMGEQHIVLYAPESYASLHEEAGFEKVHLQTNGLDVETIMKAKHQDVDHSTIFEIQDRIDAYLKGDLIRGFWRCGDMA